MNEEAVGKLCGRVLSAADLYGVELGRCAGTPEVDELPGGLLRLHRAGLIALPAPRNGNGRALQPRCDALPEAVTLSGSVQALAGLRLEAVVGAADSRLWNALIARWHDLGYTLSERVPPGVLHAHRFTRVPGSLGQPKDRRRPVLIEITFVRPAASGRPARPVTRQLKAVRVTLKAPARPDRTLPEVSVTARLAEEINPPPGEAPLQWLLPTDPPVENAAQALEKLSWYLCR